jgi:hypothetical protein
MADNGTNLMFTNLDVLFIIEILIYWSDQLWEMKMN